MSSLHLLRSRTRGVAAGFVIALLAPLLPYALPAFSDSTPSSAPVRQLVEWEIGANASMDDDALRRLALHVLGHSRDSDFPPGLLAKVVKLARFASLAELRASLKRGSAAAVTRLSRADLAALAAVPVPIEYYEIPWEELQRIGPVQEHSLASVGDKNAKQSVFFERHGKRYVRWFVHPLEAAPPIRSIVAQLATRGVGVVKRVGDYKAHFTASRSLIVFKSPSYEDAISLKVSLPTANGPFGNKAIRMKEWNAWSNHNRYLEDALVPGAAPELAFQPEPTGVGLRTDTSHGSVEDGFLVRSLQALTRDGHYYLPAFALLDEKVGREIARRNGSDDPAAFWRKHFLEPFARGAADLRAYTGAQHTSPHSQNLLVELDRDLRPTGKVVLRDADFYVDQDALQYLNRVIPKDQETGMAQNGGRHEQFTLRNGLKQLPSWLSDDEYARWTRDYFETYGRRYAEVTGSTLRSPVYRAEVHGGRLVDWAPVGPDNPYLTGSENNFHRISLQERGSSPWEWYRRVAQARAANAPLPKGPEPGKPAGTGMTLLPDGFEGKQAGQTRRAEFLAQVERMMSPGTSEKRLGQAAILKEAIRLLDGLRRAKTPEDRQRIANALVRISRRFDLRTRTRIANELTTQEPLGPFLGTSDSTEAHASFCEFLYRIDSARPKSDAHWSASLEHLEKNSAPLEVRARIAGYREALKETGSVIARMRNPMLLGKNLRATMDSFKARGPLTPTTASVLQHEATQGNDPPRKALAMQTLLEMSGKEPAMADFIVTEIQRLPALSEAESARLWAALDGSLDPAMHAAWLRQGLTTRPKGCSLLNVLSMLPR